MSKNMSRCLRHGHDLPLHILHPLIAKIEARNALLAKLDMEFPSRDDDSIEFSCCTQDCLFPGRHPSLNSLFSSGNYAPSLARGKGGRRRRGGGGGGKKWPNPGMVHSEVLKLYANIPIAGSSGPLVIGSTNLEFWLKSKAVYFEDSANEIVIRTHLHNTIEVGKDGNAHTGKIAGYAVYTSAENSRKQAVGQLAHPRLKLVAGPIELKSVSNVQNIPDLRPGFLCIYLDTVTGQYIAVVTVHLKSMLGGPKVTSVVRYKQLQNLVKELTQVLKVEARKLGVKLEDIGQIIAGDFNFPINDKSYNDADPLYQDGFTCLERHDTRGTQIMKDTRLDAIFYKNVKSGVVDYEVIAYYKVQTLGRSLTDHATIRCKLKLPGSQSNLKVDDGSTTKPTDTPADKPADAKQPVGGEDLPEIKLTFGENALRPPRKFAGKRRR